MSKPWKRLRIVGLVLVGLAVTGVLTVAGIYFYLAPQLPSIETLKDTRLQVPLRIYSHDGALIAEYGEMKRTPVRFAEIPPRMVQAVLAAEDDRFFEHPGVDYQGLVRAAFYLAITGEKGQGGSTITMQVARNFFLSTEKTFLRKLKEILLALKIERELTKEEILELYLNKIFLGNRAYGVAAAAQIYYGKGLNDLDLAQIAMIAGLPKAPSLYNPVVNPSRALLRRNYVINRMQELGFIDAQQADAARQTPVTASLHAQPTDLEAPYVAEMARAEMAARFGEEGAYTAGYKVYTTIDSRLQNAANGAVRHALLDYDRRHGYRGAEARLKPGDDPLGWEPLLAPYQKVGGLVPGMVVKLEEKSALVYIGPGEPVRVEWAGLEWARRYIDDERAGDPPLKAADILRVGDVVRLEPQPENQWRLAQVPQVSAALVSLRPSDGAVNALVGGFDFFESKFNRVIQAQRQPGSAFKPFVYSAALEKGFTPASVINDAPVVFEDAELEGTWRPENFSGKFYGPTRLREALVGSRNLVSIRLLRSIGVRYALDYATRFGFDSNRLPHDLSLALGSGSMTPMELVRGYAVFANGGFLVDPYVIERVEDAQGNLLFQAEPAVACAACETAAEGAAVPSPEARPARLAPRTVSARNVYSMTSMMQDVIRRGTGRRANELGRGDLAGKTGTTNDQRDAWFCGFNAETATISWVGFDTPRPLGSSETGAGASLPLWMDYMREALLDRPENPLVQPAGLVTMRINPETGQMARPGDGNALFEIFYSENLPSGEVQRSEGTGSAGSGKSITEELF